MAAPTLPQTDPVAMLTALLSSGGTKSTTNPGDTSLLQQTFANTQAINPQALLQSIFQQGAAQIPGLQAAYGNAVGARRSGNSAIQNALNQLLAQTTLQGQNQIMTQQQNLLNTQAQVGGAVANATKGTKSTTGTPNVANSAKNLLMLQGLAKLADTEIGKSLLGTGKSSSSVGTVNNTPALAGNTAAPQMSMAPAAAPLSLGAILQGAIEQSAPQASVPEAVPEAAPEMSMAPAEMFAPVDIMSYFDNYQAPEMSMAPEGFMPEFNIMDYFE